MCDDYTPIHFRVCGVALHIQITNGFHEIYVGMALEGSACGEGGRCGVGGMRWYRTLREYTVLLYYYG